MKKNRTLFLMIGAMILILILILGGCANSESQEETNLFYEGYVEDYTDYMILENGCVIVISGNTRLLGGGGFPPVAVACPIIIQQGN